MITKRYNLNDEAYLNAYILDTVDDIPFCKKRPAILIAPGGGYGFCSEREAEPIAMRYLAEGYSAFVLFYTCNKRFPAPLLDGYRAMLLIRQHATAFNIDAKKVAVWGASAGGHLAASIATMAAREDILSVLHCTATDIRPNAVILSYPVISAISYPHRDSFITIVGNDATEEQLKAVSAEYNVSKDTPPSFVWCTANDDCVPPQNSICYAKACIEQGVPVELHIFDKGPHGISDCSNSSAWGKDCLNDNCKQWVKMSIDFLDKYMLQN